jgi:hypothetical protein
MSQTLLKRAAKAELERRQRAKSGSTLSVLLRLLSPIQQQFVMDPHRFKLARCGRRAGKSFADAVYMIYECLKEPNMPCLYLGLTRDSAKDAIWPILVTILDQLGIQHDPIASSLRINFGNGSFIQLLGADATNARNRLRGRKFKLIIIDEMGFFTGADDLIMKVLVPMLSDYAGTICMTSSPGELLAGLFYEADIGKQKKLWHQYHWTLKDNPHYMKPATNPEKFANRADEEFDTIVNTIFGGNWTHPAFRREYLGEWVKDLTSLIYPYTEKNLIPKAYAVDEAQHGLGIDLGSTSANAIVVARFGPYTRQVQFVDTWIKPQVSVDELAQKIKDYMDIYNPLYIVADTGGYGRGIVDEIVRRYSLPIEAAQKSDKQFHQRIMRNDLLSGYIQIVEQLPILTEWDKLTRDENDDEIKGPPNHASDAGLYIYRKVYQTYLKGYEPKKTEEDRMIEAIEREALSEMREREEDLLY